MSINTYNQILTKGPESALPVVEDGKIRFTVDTGRLFVDGSNNARTEITDFVKGLTESEIKSQLSPLSSKIYMASDTGKLLIYNSTNDEWETVSRDAETVNGKTVGANVPADAVFTDTKDAAHIDYSNITSGLNATKVQGAIDEVVSVKQNAFERISYADWQLLTPQQQAAKPYYIYDYPASGSVQVIAEDVDYVNTTSGLSATKIQDAVDELALEKKDEYATITYAEWQLLTPEQQAAKDYYISDYPSGVLTAGNIGYNNTASGMTADDVQEAVDELKSGLTNLIINQSTTITFDADGLGTFDIPTGYIPLMAYIDENWKADIYRMSGTWIIRARFWNDPATFIKSSAHIFGIIFVKE